VRWRLGGDGDWGRWRLRGVRLRGVRCEGEVVVVDMIDMSMTFIVLMC